jgi:hypothetical protein
MGLAARIPIERREGERLGPTDGGFFDRISEFSEFRYGIAIKEHGHLASVCLSLSRVRRLCSFPFHSHPFRRDAKDMKSKKSNCGFRTLWLGAWKAPPRIF